MQSSRKACWWRAGLVCLLLGVLAGCTQDGPEALPALPAAEPLAAAAFTTGMQAQHSGKCVDVPRSSKRSGTELIQWTCHEGENQRFGFYPVAGKADAYTVKSAVSGLCVEARADGAIVQTACGTDETQEFTLKPTAQTNVFSLVNEQSGKCLDVFRALSKNRTTLLEYRCHGNDNQLFELAGYSGPGTSPEPRAVKVVAAGDIACDPASSGYNGGDGTASNCRMRYTAERAEKLNPDAVLALGDLQYGGGFYEDFMTSYDASWGRFKAKTYPVPGNHEYDSENAAGYYKYFGSRAGDPKKGYYSFDLGDWHIVALNTNKNCEAVDCAAGSAQERWLRADLAANTKKCVLATMHYPRYSSGRHGSYAEVDALWDALVEGGAELVLAGHSHHYERFEPQDTSGARSSEGLRQFIVGTGGKSLYGVNSPRSDSEAIIAGKYGVLELELSQDDYAWAFVTEKGDRMDVGSASCN